ncbi:uncharacterized protein LOC115470415 [Microcaecilia unicolor]|uniref:Uncharacterized protein LOC115470415 n=1 Tax=Microcaecilia unicolor TaxID=1415580 RepID=A0A6P7Y3L9_9AMPH|nr:uncharacterized protein LOC115470415 [Microcaecilia unicolor]
MRTGFLLRTPKGALEVQESIPDKLRATRLSCEYWKESLTSLTLKGTSGGFHRVPGHGAPLTCMEDREDGGHLVAGSSTGVPGPRAPCFSLDDREEGNSIAIPYVACQSSPLQTAVSANYT